MEHHGISKEQALALGKVERDLGSVDVAEAMPQPRGLQEPVTINVGWLPAEQPMCPHCHTGLHAVRQNQAGDSLFECVQAGCVGDGYMAVYRVQGPRWEQFQGRGVVEGWRQPVRMADVMAQAQRPQPAPAAPAEKPKGAWPGEAEATVAKASSPDDVTLHDGGKDQPKARKARASKKAQA
jgi:hypothetical protein